MHTSFRNPKKMLCVVLLVSCICHGCTLFPPPSEMIMSPSVNDPILEIVQSFLPKDASILCFENQSISSFYQKYDIDGNHQYEILFASQFSQGGAEQNTIQVSILKKFPKGWKMLWECKSFASGVDHLELKDLTNDQIPEIIIGWASGTGLEKGLDIYYFIDTISFETSRSFSTTYSTFEIVNLLGTHEKQNMNDKVEVIIWKKEFENAYSIDILQFSDRMTITQSTLEPIPLNEYYPSYFKSVVSYYEPLLEKYPDQTIYWYYYSLALFYSQHFEKALEACLHGIALNKHSTSFPYSYDYMYLHGKILMKLQSFDFAKKQFHTIQSYFATKKTISIEEANALSQAELCLSEIALQEEDIEGAFQFLLKTQKYLESVFQSQSQSKRISKIPLDVFVSRVDYQRIQSMVQTHFSYQYLQEHLPTLLDGHNIIRVTSSIYPNQSCELHAQMKTFHHGSNPPFKVVDFSDIQPEFYFMNGIDNGLLHHAILWENDTKETLQVLFQPPQSLWPLNENSRIDQILVQNSPQDLYVFLYKDNPMILLTQFNPDKNQWTVLWHPKEQEWRGKNGIVQIHSSQNQFETMGSSLDNDDIANCLFIESMNSLYRTFKDTWVYDSASHTFQCIEHKINPTPYSTLVDFIFQVSTNQTEKALPLLTDSQIISELDLSQLIQNPLKQEWSIVQHDSYSDLRYQIQIATTQGNEFCFYFDQIGTQWKISSIQKEK